MNPGLEYSSLNIIRYCHSVSIIKYKQILNYNVSNVTTEVYQWVVFMFSSPLQPMSEITNSSN